MDLNLEDLLSEFPNHVFKIHKKDKGKKQAHYGVPTFIYIRHEVEQQMLYIDTRFITQAGLVENLKEWRDLPSYQGAMLKRINSGSGKKIEPACNCAVFSLKPITATNPTEAEEESNAISRHIRPRRGKKLVVNRVIGYNKKAAEAATSILALNKRIQGWEDKYGQLPLWKELKTTLKEAKKFYEDSYNMLSTGRRKRIMLEPSPIKTVKSRLKPDKPDIRYRCAGLDELMSKDISAIYKNIRKFVTDEKGNTTLQEKEYRPPIDKTEWVGRYEQGTERDGSMKYKHLYIPTNVLRSGAYESLDILQYKKDPRFVLTCQKYVGHRALHCALFDLTIKFEDK